MTERRKPYGDPNTICLKVPAQPTSDYRYAGPVTRACVKHGRLRDAERSSTTSVELVTCKSCLQVLRGRPQLRLYVAAWRQPSLPFDGATAPER